MRAILPPDAEPDLVREFFSTSVGFFVEVGANDPRVLSQTWQLERDGWNGVLIEPQPQLAERLRRERTAKVYQVACSSPANAGKRMSLYCAGPHSSLSADWTSRAEGALSVPVRCLDEVLVDANSPQPIDFLSIDVEGHGPEVLKGVDLARWRPRLVLIEDHVLSLRIHRCMILHGYRWMRRTGLNSWYVPTEDAPPMGLIGWLQFVRKYYLGLPFRHLRDAVRRTRGQLRA